MNGKLTHYQPQLLTSCVCVLFYLDTEIIELKCMCVFNCQTCTSTSTLTQMWGFSNTQANSYIRMYWRFTAIVSHCRMSTTCRVCLYNVYIHWPLSFCIIQIIHHMYLITTTRLTWFDVFKLRIVLIWNFFFGKCKRKLPDRQTVRHTQADTTSDM